MSYTTRKAKATNHVRRMNKIVILSSSKKKRTYMVSVHYTGTSHVTTRHIPWSVMDETKQLIPGLKIVDMRQKSKRIAA